MNRTETVVPLQQTTDANHAPDNEIHDRLNKPDRALAYPSEQTAPLSDFSRIERRPGTTGTRSTDGY